MKSRTPGLGYPHGVSTPLPRFRDPLLLGAVFALCVVFWGLQLARGPLLSSDELFSPTAGMLLEAGLPLRADTLRLKSFCGGCAINTVAASGLFTVLPARLWVWRLLPFGFALLTLLAGWRVGGWVGGRAGAASAAWLLVLAPPAWREMAAQGYGNHVEVMALVLLGIGAFARFDQLRRPREAFLSGLLAGFAAFYAYIASFLAPALALVWWRGRRNGPSRVAAGLVGLVVGVAPWCLLRMLPPRSADATSVYGRSLGDLLTADVGAVERAAALLGPGVWGNLFAPALRLHPWVGGLWTLLALTAFVATALAARASAVAAAVMACAVLFVIEWLLLAPGLPSWPPVLGAGGPVIHYLLPLVAMAPIAAAALWREGPLRRLAGPVTAGMLALGLWGVALDLANPWTLSSIDRPAVDLRPGAVPLSIDLPLAPGQLRVPVDAALGLRPGRRAARRIVLAQLGRALPGAMMGWTAEERRALVPFVDALDPADRRWLDFGLTWDHQPERDLPLAGLPDALTAPLGPWPPGRTRDLLRASRRHRAIERAREHPAGPRGRIARLQQELVAERDPLLRALLAWEIGIAAADSANPERGTPTSAAREVGLALGALPALSGPLRAAALEGLVDSLVEDWCQQPAGCAPLRASVAAPAAIDEAVCAHHLRCP